MTAAPRLSLQYALIFGVTGVSLPFAAVWLQSQGMDGARIGLVLAAPMLARAVTGPLAAVWADGLKERRSAIAILSLIAAVGYAAAALADGFALQALAWFIGAGAAAALPPLVDTLNLRLARRDGYPFAIPRGFGSAAFVAANLLMGGLLLKAPADLIIVWIVAGSLLAGLWAWRGLPDQKVEAAGPGWARVRGLGRLLIDARLMIALMAVGCVQAAHAFYYGFSALIWTGQGLPAVTTGALWAFSVVVEIGFMWWAWPRLGRMGLGPRALLIIGGVAAALRWALMAMAPPLWALWPLQTLHALSFAATYLAGVELVERLSPPSAHTSAQTLSSVLSSGVLIGLATLASGPLYDAFGPGGYWAMTALAALGAALGLMVSRRP